jgi:hypothetical protein
LALVAAGFCWAQEKSPSDLIRLLATPTEDPFWSATFTCGSLYGDYERGRPLAKELADLGGSAIPDLESALDSVEAHGQRSAFAYRSGWLIMAYAKILGPAAFPRLRRMKNKIEIDQDALQVGIAIALGLTSYVDARSLEATKMCLQNDPRDGLDRLILAWQHNDVKAIEKSLGAEATSSLKALHNELSTSKARPDAAVGYRFESSERWAQAREVFDGAPYLGLRIADSIEVPTRFFNGTGAGCGVLTIRFAMNTNALLRPDYYVDNRNIDDLVHLIASCASGSSLH